MLARSSESAATAREKPVLRFGGFGVGGIAAPADRGTDDVDFTSELMRLAAVGSRG